jgi:hypothetical protein|uniref:Hypothetical chloroplast RF20 n=1 Tax=Scherffelia dubia TaxID=3190 RepID=A0A142BYE6_SCHDU|nr:hypothetical chloroplast RF20 [Scherffelia dubia]YP_009241550.1 hypothetical chloroplast RF20 [Scherffelia dubia]AMP43438.1 hypothetical chloroplast RF20 [Scherffelia dubia]AMP43457.1 hypothetical chloroplast RF20 [Scherffelia dubia]
MQTRIFRLLRQIFLIIKNQTELFLNFFAESFFYLFLGFLTGNLFGTLLSTIRTFGLWDGIIILSLLGFLEFLGKLVYKTQTKLLKFWKLLNSWKIGIFLGFFIEAFKVGS